MGIHNARKLVVAVLLVTLFDAPRSAFALDPGKATTQYGQDVWLRQNGLPANAVNAALQTHDGYLWLGTSAGLFRFDGVRFERVSTDPDSTGNLDAVAALCEASDGSLWIGTAFNSSFRLKDGVTRRYGENEGVMSQNITNILQCRDGRLMLGTSNGLYVFANDKFEPMPVSVGYVTDLAEDPRGMLLVGTHAGVRIFDGLRELPPGDMTVRTRNQMITALYVDRQQNVWIGTAAELLSWTGNEVRTYTMNDGLSDYSITAIDQDSDGNLWVGTNAGGINRLTAGKWTAFTTKEGLCNNHVISIIEDREGSLWISTMDGLARLKDVSITPYTSKDGLPNDCIASVIQTPDGSMYFLSDQGSSITRLQNGKMTTTAISVGPAYVARDGSLWMGQTGSLTRIKDGQMERFDVRSGLPNKWITAIGEDRESILLSLDGVGVRRFVNGQLKPYMLKGGEVYNYTDYVACFFLEEDGSMFIGKSCGLEKIQDGERVDFASDGKLSSHYWVGSIADDGKGGVWLGSPRSGLTHFKGGKFIGYTTKNGLFSNEIYCVLRDDRGDIWLSSPRGIGHMLQQDIDDYEAGRTQRLHTQVFLTADGMKTEECFGQWGPGGWKANDGHLWFATKKGAVMIDPLALRHNELPPPVLVEKVVADGQVLREAQLISLPPDKGNFEFHYTALSFLVPERVLFKYKLEGYDRDWVQAGTRRVAYYTGLPPGSYLFRVMACNNDGIWNPTPVSLEFYLAPHFYQTYWFYGLCVLALVFAVFGGVRLRIRNLKERGRQLESLVDARTNEMQQQRALLQEQRSFLRTIIDLNPSFIFAKDRDGRFTLANSALATAYGASPEHLIGKTDADFNARRDEVEKFRGDDLQVMDTQTKKFIPEEEFTDTEGGQHWMQVIKIPIVTEGGVAQQMLGVATDITERKQAEERLRASLREKEVLLKEIHHRVKNNLQVVSSLLSLQAGQMQDDQSRQALSECKQRVRSMALIHENLYRSGDLAKINFGDYLPAVTNELVRSFGRGISTSFELEPILLPIDVAIPCGLIVNELVTNALKHAFPEGRQGAITVSLRRTDEASAEIGVRDDGVGMPSETDIRSLKSMGMNLVLSLVDQIGGTVAIERNGGTIFRVAFPTKPHESH